jgi:hypothetical protein
MVLGFRDNESQCVTQQQGSSGRADKVDCFLALLICRPIILALCFYVLRNVASFLGCDAVLVSILISLFHISLVSVLRLV